MKNNIKTISTSTTTVIDKESGEVIEESIKKHKIVVDKEEFTMIYSSMWNAVYHNPLSASDLELLSYLLDNYSDGTVFNISKSVKLEVAKKTGKSLATYNKSTAKLLKGDFIKSVNESRTYIINPQFAFRGSSRLRKNAILKLETSK